MFWPDCEIKRIEMYTNRLIHAIDQQCNMDFAYQDKSGKHISGKMMIGKDYTVFHMQVYVILMKNSKL